jgi:Icc-related predicted phosphoesterase
MMALGGLAGLGITGAGITACALMLISPDYHAFRTPTFYAHGGELPKLLQVSDKFSAATAEYQSSYEQALSGLDVLIGAAAGQKPDTSKTSFLVGSDVHSNWLTLPAVERYARGRPVFLVGDYSQQGTPLEAAIADRAARLGTPTVAVSGNHDTPGVMRRLAQAGAIVLTHDGRLDRTGHVRGPSVVRIAGALVAAFEDPLERSAGSFGHRLDFTNEELALQKQVVIDWFDRLDPRPDMVMVHDFRIAEALRLHSAAQSDQPVLILTGHDHEQHVDRTRNAVVVDGGTLGAGGVFGVGEQQAGFAQVHLDGTNWPQAVDLISADPISGDASAEHIVLTRLPVGQSEPATPTGQASASAR